MPEILRPAVGPLLETIDTLSEQIAYCDQLLKHLAQTRYPETELLTQVPGVGTLTALAFRLTIDDAGRFRHSRDVGGVSGVAAAAAGQRRTAAPVASWPPVGGHLD